MKLRMSDYSGTHLITLLKKREKYGYKALGVVVACSCCVTYIHDSTAKRSF